MVQSVSHSPGYNPQVQVYLFFWALYTHLFYFTFKSKRMVSLLKIPLGDATVACMHADRDKWAHHTDDSGEVWGGVLELSYCFLF